MRKAGVAELKACLSEYLAAVKSGEEILITERGHPIARIAPIPAHSRHSRSIQDLIRAGVLRSPERELDEAFWDVRGPDDPTAAVRSALLEEREEDR
ncbi:MAG: type II toxin-antitoxin system Phd/YefM family antitoxin [Acidobacteriota bacterium]